MIAEELVSEKMPVVQKKREKLDTKKSSTHFKCFSFFHAIFCFDSEMDFENSKFGPQKLHEN